MSEELVASFRRDGWALWRNFFPSAELAEAGQALAAIYPSVSAYEADPGAFGGLRGDPFGGVKWWPLDVLGLDLLPMHPKILELARTLLGRKDIRLLRSAYQLKLTGAADYEQVLHYDYPNHSLVVPGPDEIIGFFVYFTDVTAAHGPTMLVADGDAGPVAPDRTHPLRDQAPNLYGMERAAVGPAGSLLAYRSTTLHRGSSMTAASGTRLTLQFAYGRPGPATGYTAWPRLGEEVGLVHAVVAATPDQRAVLGFPLPGDAYWTADTVAAVAARYPGIDLQAYQG